VVGALRHKGRLTDYSYKRQALGKQLKQADQRHATRAVIIQAGGQMVAVKDFSTGQQEDMSLERFLTEA
jgi:histidyl-tRNA synthetase